MRNERWPGRLWWRWVPSVAALEQLADDAGAPPWTNCCITRIQPAYGRKRARMPRRLASGHSGCMRHAAIELLIAPSRLP
jgi:hypothetical protein